MAKSDRFYFENFTAAAECCCTAAEYLETCVKNYDIANIQQMIAQMHEYENRADAKKHEMTKELARAFVTPLDREDLAEISGNIDDVADKIEEVLQRFYMDRIKTVYPEAIEFAEKIVKCCKLMKNLLGELANFKKPQKLKEMVVELSHMEEECDRLYLRAIYELPERTHDVLEIICWREIYDHLEACADTCEHVGDSVEVIVMKNT